MKRKTLMSAIGAMALAATTSTTAAASPGTSGSDPSSFTGKRWSASAPKFTKYVSMGDSYVAGPLIPWNSTWCFRSNNNYPSWLATHLGLYDTSGGFTDASCSSADTTSFTQSQPTPSPSLTLANQPPQVDSLSADTDLVTIGIGGNDYRMFGTLAFDCPSYRDSDPTGSPCKDHFTKNGVDTLKAVLPNTQKNITRVVRTVREHAPAAKVVLVGYPRVVPPSGYCPDVVPLADGDYAWADSLNRGLNTAVSKAAKATGATYVDTYGPALGHDACAGDAAWIQGKDTNLLKAYAMHPNAAGMRAIGDLVYKELTGSNPPPAAKRTLKRSGADSSSGARQRQWIADHPDALTRSRG